MAPFSGLEIAQQANLKRTHYRRHHLGLIARAMIFSRFFPRGQSLTLSANLTPIIRVVNMRLSLPVLLAFSSSAAANSAATCISAISALYFSHPKCAQSCLGCIDSNESFAHACDINSNCCQGPEAIKFIPLVYGCVSTVCDAAEAQKSWGEFLRNCRRNGYPVDEADTPGGYVYVVGSGGGGDGVKTGTTMGTLTAMTGTGAPPESTVGGSGSGSGSESGSGEVIGDASGNGAASGQTGGDGNAGSSGSSSGLGKGEIIGISLGAVSAVAAVVGLALRWKHLQIAKKNAAAIGPGEGAKI
ncbi:hypothetical protein QBC34DRAFT_478490 [Podospora aff. communis PSN243]|uniref:Extracellular membrane protein CFEM domain-containing protein n=1 Tax=Podospora aff. communis PSN243 TaxID=3040156 RepID=A0AAV9G4C6_9PEZI|nr:hypothetical protein QBC34DRAFT_478490 [Podospora aff. communis PSN243]